MKMKLTQSIVKQIEARPDKPQWIHDMDTKNLLLYVGKNGTKTWYFYYRDKRGKGANHKLGDARVMTVAQARDAALDMASRVLRGENIKKEKPALKITLGEFINNVYVPQHKPSKHTLWRLNKQFKNKFYELPVEELTVKDLIMWCNSRIESGIKSATVNKDIGALKAALEWGVYQGTITENPLAKLRRLPEEGISDEADSREIIRYLSDDERSRLYDALESREKKIRAARNIPDSVAFADHIKPMVIISLTSGIRKGSLFGFLWSDIDFDNNTLTLRPSNVKSKKKTILPMSADTKATLLKWKEQTGNDGLVFKSPVTGTMLTNVKKAWAGVLKEAKIENFRWHDMRHDFASRLVMSGVDLFHVQKLMGHSDISMTQRYAHLAPNDLQRAIDAIDSMPGKIIGRIPVSA
jgi:integrase